MAQVTVKKECISTYTRTHYMTVHIVVCSCAFTVAVINLLLRKPSSSFVMCVCRSAFMEHPRCHWTDFCEILYLVFVRKSFEAFRFWLNSVRNNGIEAKSCVWA
jgi:hypothetical protein